MILYNPRINVDLPTPFTPVINKLEAHLHFKGLNISFVESLYPGEPNILVMDTEGLLAMEKNNDQFNVQMALLSIAVSDVVILNTSKNFGTDMSRFGVKKFLYSIVVTYISQLEPS